MAGKDEIIRIAKMSRVGIEGIEDELVADISNTLSYAEKLNELGEIPDEYEIEADHLNALREDKKREVLDSETEKIIDAFPEKDGRLLRVKPIFKSE